VGDPGNDPPRPPFAVLRAKLEAKLAEMRQRRRARMPSSPLTDEAWRRGQQNLALRLAAVEEDRREAPLLLTELLARSEPDRFPALATDPRYASPALAELLLAQKPRTPLDDTFPRSVLVIAERLDPEVIGAGPIEHLKAAAWARIGDSLREAQELARADTAFRRAATHLANAPEPVEEARLRRRMALLSRDRRDLPRAIRLQERAVHVLAKYAQAPEISYALIELAALRAEGDRAAALEAALRDAAVVLADDPEATDLSLRRLEELALRLSGMGESRQAEALLDAAFRHLRPALRRVDQAALESIAGRVALQTGRRDLAARAFALAWPALLDGGRADQAAAVYIDLLANLLALSEHARADRALGEGMPLLARAAVHETARSALNLAQIAVQTAGPYAGLLEELASLLRAMQTEGP
jgi:hypothetical protein